MNKSIFSCAVGVFVAVVGVSANAANIAQKTAFTGQGTVSNTECTLIGDTVTLNLSSGVQGVYKCDEPNSVITVAACHETGSRKPKAINCAADPADTAEPPTKFLPAGCTDATGTVTISDFSAFKAGSNGGSIAQDVLGGNCAAGTVQTFIDK